MLGNKYGLTRQRIQQVLIDYEKEASGEKKRKKRLWVAQRLENLVYPSIRRWMIENELTYAGFSACTDIPYQTLRGALTGDQNPTKRVIDEILRVTGMTYEEAFRK